MKLSVVAVSCGREFCHPNRITKSSSRSVEKMARRKDRGWGPLVSAMQWSILQLYLWAIAARAQNTSARLCTPPDVVENCTLPWQGGIIRLPVCNGVDNSQVCRMVIHVLVPAQALMTLKMGVEVERIIASFVGSQEVQHVSIELVKQGDISIWFSNSMANVTVERMIFNPRSIVHLLNPGDQVLLIEITHQDKERVFYSSRVEKPEDMYWLLRCHGSCPQNLTMTGWDAFQYQRRDVKNGSITYIGRGNDKSVEFSEGDWEVYQMIFLKTCGSSCHLCMDINPAATSFMKAFGLLKDTVDNFNPCVLSPVLQSTKCEISNHTGGQCLRLSELNMSSLNISISPSSPFPLEPIRFLEKLILSNNKLSGSVSAFNKFQDLTYLDLRGNFFQVMNLEETMPNLTYLNLARNKLTNVTLDKLTGLKELSLIGNNLRGNFSSVFQKRSLRKLDIRLNSFSGVVPDDMLTMTWFRRGNCKLQGKQQADDKDAPFGEGFEEWEDPCSSRNRLRTALIVAAGVIGALLLGCAAFAVFYFLVNEKPRGKDSSSLPRSNSSHEGTGFLRRQKLHDVGFPREFGMREVEAATETATTTLLGKGAFGDVFEATLDGSRVVIKFRAKGTTSLLPEFQRDVKKLGSYNHKNLVRVLGYCDDKEYQALVIEWMPNGSLEYHLYGSRIESALDWRTRLKVLAGAASGIEFLHGGDYRQICYSVSPLIHCDIKSSNILLGDHFEAKVADFGYFKPKLFGDKFHSDLRYFQGYLDPEYLSNDQKNELDKKSDVFSFGVVILETVTGRPPIDTFGGHEPMTIGHWVRNRKNDGNLKDIVDPRLPEGSYLIDVVKSVVEVALECLNASSSARPTIKSVRRSLEDAYKTESRAGNSMSMELPSLETQPSGHISR